MAKKKITRTKKTIAKSECRSVLANPLTWLVSAFILAAIVVATTLGIYAAVINANRNAINDGKLAVFDGFASDFIATHSVRDDQPTYQVMTGYGVSDENDVFYITFNYYLYNESGAPDTDNPHAAIVYIYPDGEHNGYAYGYYDDNPSYRPSGVYRSI